MISEAAFNHWFKGKTLRTTIYTANVQGVCVAQSDDGYLTLQLEDGTLFSELSSNLEWVDTDE